MDAAVGRPIPRGALVAVGGGAAALAFLGTLVASDDPDMFHHLALGREIVRSGLPSTEPFVFPLRGEPAGVPPYWLGSVAIYAWAALFGEEALPLLPAAIGALIALILLLDSAPRGRRHTLATIACAALPIALALETYRYRAVPRTEIFSAVLLAAAMWAIRRYEDGRPGALYAFPAVAALWSNLHTGMAVSLVPLGLLIVCGLAGLALRRATGVELPGTLPPRRVVGAVAIAIAAVLASGLHPSSESPVATAVRFVLGALRSSSGPGAAGASVVPGIVEMQGGGAALFRGPVGALIVLTAVVLLVRPRAMRLRELATLAVFAVLPFLAVRFAMFFAVVAAPIAARSLGEAVSSIPDRVGAVRARAAVSAVVALGAIATIPYGMLAPHIRFGTGVVPGAFPRRGADYLQSLGFDGRLFNTFQFGGYLEWRGIGPPFQDGRGVLRPADAAAAMAGPTRRDVFDALDDRYRFDALLVSYPAGDVSSGAASGVFDPDEARWALVAFDDAGLLYLRRDGKYAERATREAYQHVRPANPLFALRPANPAGARAEYRRSVEEAPWCVRCRFLLGEMALAFGDRAEAARTALPGLERAFGPDRGALESIMMRAGAVR